MLDERIRGLGNRQPLSPRVRAEILLLSREPIVETQRTWAQLVGSLLNVG